eukprot:TRINITY_DN7958_c0_g1_i2.p1 TRINITY_DN7958_c0_g1~~TRINITY_DN7958_c0_g1_i2.p1  ORF type:complete len:763 (-),score=135.17 TRINITY_DN7958_c0_g1_i2:467-2755(-)
MTTLQAHLDEEDDEWIEMAKHSIKSQGFHLKRALGQGKYMEGMRSCAAMIMNLRAGNISPKRYYDIYMDVCDHLRFLEISLSDSQIFSKFRGEIYEAVQEEPNILPRLYLMITVGSVYMRLKRCAPGPMLLDMVEMCRGVQHPMRGLFLRHFLMQMMKDKLPVGIDPSEQDGKMTESLDFLLKNFMEMNRLWMRLQYQIVGRNKEKTERERIELQVLVGTNLVRLSELEGLTVSQYATDVLPRILEEIVNSRDKMTQQYLMECVIQVFPDEFHLTTLDVFLSTCLQLHDDVNLRDVAISLINRLVGFARRSPSEIPKNLEIFDTFLRNVQEIVQTRLNLRLDEILGLYSALLTLAHRIYPEKRGYVDEVYHLCAEKLKSLSIERIRDPLCIKMIVEMLAFTIESYGSVSAVLQLRAYTELIGYLEFFIRRKVSINVVITALKKPHLHISSPLLVDRILSYISPLIHEQPDGIIESEECKNETFGEEQHLVAKLVHICSNHDTDIQYEIIKTVVRHLVKGGFSRKTITLPSVFFQVLMLVSRIKEREILGDRVKISSKKALKLVSLVIAPLLDEDPYICIKFYLEAVIVADRCGFEDSVNELITQIFSIYEERISESKQQYQSVHSMICTFQQLQTMSFSAFDNLITKMTLFAGRLLKKPDQCRAIYLCSHLFWIVSAQKNEFRHGKKVLDCLKKSLRIADACVDSSTQVQLFLEILSEYLYYVEWGNEYVSFLDLFFMMIIIILSNMTMRKADKEMKTKTSI